MKIWNELFSFLWRTTEESEASKWLTSPFVTEKLRQWDYEKIEHINQEGVQIGGTENGNLSHDQ